MKKISLDQIRIDGGTQSREVIDQPTVYKYLEDMKNGDEFPKMFTMFDGTTYWLVDGFHRYHAYKLLGIKEIVVDYKPGTLQEAQVLSFGMNNKHGKPRTEADRRKSVEQALEHPLTKHMTNYELAKKVCHVSESYVASVRSPEAKKKQEEAKKKHIMKKAKELEAEMATSPTSTPAPAPTPEPNPNDGDAPSREEIEAAEEALKADQEMMYKLLESDDALKTAMEENKRLNLRVSQLEARLRGLMNERNEAVKMVKQLQKQIDKSKAKK